MGAFVVTTGHGADEFAAEFLKQHDDYNSIMVKALADRLAEAFAEYLHKRARADWGYGAEEKLSNDDLIAEKYRGIRPAPGYSACPDHTESDSVQDSRCDRQYRHDVDRFLRDVAAASVSGYYFGHPDSRYFAVDRITRDQVQSYAKRKGMSIIEAERWLAPNLGYD